MALVPPAVDGGDQPEVAEVGQQIGLHRRDLNCLPSVRLSARVNDRVGPLRIVREIMERENILQAHDTAVHHKLSGLPSRISTID